jgi:hypothetical protein
MEDVGIFYGHLVNFMAIWSILWPFGTFCSHFGIFFPALVCSTKKNLATLFRQITLTTTMEMAFRL